MSISGFYSVFKTSALLVSDRGGLPQRVLYMEEWSTGVLLKIPSPTEKEKACQVFGNPLAPVQKQIKKAEPVKAPPFLGFYIVTRFLFSVFCRDHSFCPCQTCVQGYNPYRKTHVCQTLNASLRCRIRRRGTWDYPLHFLLNPIRPIKPEPNSQTAEGIGTALMSALPVKTAQSP